MDEFFKFVIRFFHGWRRRLGLAMLAMALGTLALSNYGNWSRFSGGYLNVGTTDSEEPRHDAFRWPNRGRGFMWSVWRFPEDSGLLPGELRSSSGWQFGDQDEPDFDIFAFLNIQSHWQFGGFHVVKGKAIGKHRVVNIPISFVIVPDWFITLPLTALSAYLLLFKPRHTTSKNISELTAKEGA